LVGDFHLDASSTLDSGSLLNESTDNTKSIMERSVGLVENESVRSSEEDGDSLTLVGAFGHLDDLSVSGGALFNESGSSELILSELVNVSNGGSVNSSADEIDVVSVDVLDDHNALLGKEMEGQIGNGVSEDGFLEEEHVDSGGDDFLYECDDVLTFFLKESVHSGVVSDNDVGLEVRLGGGKGELNETNLGSLNSAGTTTVVRGLLVNETESVNELGIINGSTELGVDSNVSEVNVISGVPVNDLKYGIDGHGGEEVGVMVDNLG